MQTKKTLVSLVAIVMGFTFLLTACDQMQPTDDTMMGDDNMNNEAMDNDDSMMEGGDTMMEGGDTMMDEEDSY